MNRVASLTGLGRGAKILAICVVFTGLALLLQSLHLPSELYNSRTRTSNSEIAHLAPKKPANTTVSALVFYGRKDRVSCLRCYLEVGIPCYWQLKCLSSCFMMRLADAIYSATWWKMVAGLTKFCGL